MSQYDKIGSAYDIVKQTHFNILEQFNFKKHVAPYLAQPDVALLDLACGTGFYSERLAAWGAASIVGVDLSPTMVEFARQRLELTQYAGKARFMVGDGTKPQVFGDGPNSFDVVTGAWFLNYAKDAEELTAMFKTIKMNMKPSGVYVGIGLYPTNDLEGLISGLDSETWARSGVSYYYNRDEDRLGGQGVTFTVKALATNGSYRYGEGRIEFESYHLKREVYERAAGAAGFESDKLQWHSCDFLEPTWRELLQINDDASWGRLKQWPLFNILVLKN